MNSGKFSSVKIPRFMSPVGLQDQQEGDNGARSLLDGELMWTCTQERNNFAPNEFREVVNLSGLAVYKGSNTKGKSNSATERK